MLKIIAWSCLLFSSLTLYAQNQKKIHLKTGDWTGSLHLNKTNYLPFKLSINKGKTDAGKIQYNFNVHNGKETITLINPCIIDDSMHLEFPEFNSKLVLKIKGNKNMEGYWLNLNKGINYKIPCHITKGYFKRFQNPKLYLSHINPSNYNGKWESTFEPQTTDAYKAIGLFTQSFNEIEGTFLTETGDYRFLEGNVVGDSLYLSCFDGSHAFLFTGKMSDKNINGKFYSGKHWETEWIANRNDTFELKHPDSITYSRDEVPFSFTLSDLQGNEFVFPNPAYQNKVTIIQIMGTWCPNCMDETRYFKELYERYNKDGLEIISIGYEIGSDFQEQVTKIKTLRDRLDLHYLFLVGGSANKGLASEHFGMLNQIISFPTAIIIGKDGTIKKIHTGFNGPGTGSYYDDFVLETNKFIEGLLKE